MSPWSAPVPLDVARHDRKAFRCGTDALDHWVRRYAAQSHVAGTARVFVSTPVDDPTRIAGLYALAASSIVRAGATPAAAKGSPEPVPALLLGRLAVDERYRGQGLGAALLRDALLRCLAVADSVGIAVLLVHAQDEPARQFYEHFGFEAGALDSRTLMLRVKDIPRSV